eukprot:1937283-Heterocapsa_arctica.AAC.1
MAADGGEGRRDREGAERLVTNQCEKMVMHEIHSDRGRAACSTRTLSRTSIRSSTLTTARMTTRLGWTLG